MRNIFRRIWAILTFPFRIIIWIIKKIGKWISNIANEIHEFFTAEVEDTPLPDTLSKTVENPTELLTHLGALRKHLLRSVLVLIVTVAFSFAFSKQIIAYLSRPLEGGMDALIAIEVTEPISTVMRVSLLSGFAIAFPYIALEIWLFIAPGLKKKARISGLFAIPIATIFFLAGMAFAYYVMLPAALPFLLNFMGISTIPRPSSYIKFVTGIMFWLGVAFEFPLVIYLLARLGIVNAEFLRKQWRIAIVIIAVIAAIITPTIDPVNMALVMGPMILLYFLSIILAVFAQKSRTNSTENAPD
jgi:sec-independent protein translocase protein TatC